MDITPIITWLAPIVSTIIITAASASINSQVKRHEQIADERHAETEAKRRVEEEWRARIDALIEEQGRALQSVADDRTEWYSWRDEIIRCMDTQDERIGMVLQSQCTQMRSDIIHKCHRYLDDLGAASVEEKEALHEEHEEYSAMCKANDIVNSFVDTLVERVMALPEREI